MNREILFRGITVDADFGKWHYGSLIINGELGEETAIYDCNNDSYGGVAVISETVGQFTGLTCKNGVKVFDGDIVTNDRKIKYVVSFEDGSFILRHTVLKDIDGSFYKWGNLSRVYELDKFNIEIIGNIHDNKNLLEN